LGYTFAGWIGTTHGSLSGNNYTFGLDNDTILADWTYNRYRVNLLSNFPNKVNETEESQASGTTYYYAGYDSNQKYSTGTSLDEIQLIAPTIKVSGTEVYSFDGWYTAENDGVQVITSTGEYVNATIDGYLLNGLWHTTQVKNLYAHYSNKNFDLYFDKNTGDTTSQHSKSVSYGSQYGDLATATKQGYTFSGWYTDATEGDLVSSNSLMNTPGATIYAHWVPNKVDVTVKINNLVYTAQNIKVRLNNGEEVLVNSEGIAKFTEIAVGNYDIYCSVSDTYKNVLVNSGITLEVNSDSTTATLNYYTITINEGEGTNLAVKLQDNTDLKVLTGYNVIEGAEINAVATTKTGYDTLRLVAYNTNTVETLVEINNNIILMPGFNLTIQSMANETEYTITYNSNGGEEISEQIYKITDNVIIKGQAVREGCIFDGWKLDEAVNNWQAKTYSALEVVGVGKYGNITLVAEWIGINYTVAYWDGGNTPLDTSSHVYGTASNIKTVQELNISRSGFEFVGWTLSNTDLSNDSFIKELSNGDRVQDLTTIANSTVNLYAIWSRSAHFYSGTYKATDTLATQYFNSNLTNKYYVKSPAIVTSIDGWEALGYRADVNADAVEYELNAEIFVSADLNSFYAIYSRLAQFISGVSKAETETATQYYNTNNNYSVLALTPAYIDGWTENGWRDDTDADSKLFDSNSIITSSSSVYYAVYEREILMHYNGNTNTSGETTSHNGVQYYNSNSTISDVVFIAKENGFVKTAYYFVTWTLGSITGDEYDENVEVVVCPEINSDDIVVEMYAKWTPTIYTIIFNTNDGEIIQNMNYNIESNDVLPVAVRDGYEFSYWTVINAEGNWELNEQINGGASLFGRYGNISLKAEWDEDNYTITYIKNNGQTNEIQEYSITTENLTLKKAPTRDGFKFTGWLLSEGVKNWEAKVYNENENVGGGKFGNITLVAQWSSNSYSIIFDVDGGTEIEPMLYYTSNESQSIELVETNKVGYDFYCYEIKNNSNPNSNITERKILNIPANAYGDITVKVIWTDGVVRYNVYHYVMGTNGTYPETAQPVIRIGTAHGIVTLVDEIDKNKLVDGGIVFDYASSSKGGNAQTTLELADDNSSEIHIYYKRLKHMVSLISGEGISSTTGSGEYYYGESVAINAEVENGYTWSAWSGALTSQDRDYSFAMPLTNIELTAQTTINNYLLKINYLFSTGDVAYTSYEHRYDYKYAYSVQSPEVDGYSCSIKTVIGTMPAEDYELSVVYTLNEYIITFDTNGGDVVASITYTIQSDDFLPSASRIGYTFNRWKVVVADGNWFDSVLISAGSSLKGKFGNTTLQAVWFANNNTPYTVQHYKQNLALNGYDLINSDVQSLSGQTNTEVSLTVKQYQGFTFDETNPNNVLSGNINGDGSLVLKAYYKRNIHNVNISVNINNQDGLGEYKLDMDCISGEIGFGEIEQNKYYLSKQLAYGAQVKIVASEKDGYEFVGWYDSKGTLITVGAEIELTINDLDVSYSARFRIKRTIPIIPIAAISGGVVLIISGILIGIKVSKRRRPKLPKPKKIKRIKSDKKLFEQKTTSSADKLANSGSKRITIKDLNLKK
ncbi:MAG TPA: hypothetical protein DCO89_01920, partial [Clostridiales bacterium]|nr:hypothetical protein [Clostridiales bacterium]